MNNNNGRKIPPNYENPIDNLIIANCDKLVNTCQRLLITPNMITIFRTFLSFITLYYLFNTCNISIPITGTAIFYFLDCLDGHLARSTNQVTVLGDYLDHYADMFFYFMFIIYIFIKKYNNKNLIIISTLSLTLMSMIHLGLQQKHYKILNEDEKHEELLDNINHFHNLKLKDIKWTRYFGLGTTYTFILFVIYYIKKNIC
jgi:phosphatidylglycerophosphate synthase